MEDDFVAVESDPVSGQASKRDTAMPVPQGEGIPSGWRALAPDLTPLRRHRDYRLLTVGQSVSFFGSMITYVAVPYQVFQPTRLLVLRRPGTGGELGRRYALAGPLAQWQSDGLLIRQVRVRVPGGPPESSWSEGIFG